jgi:hypothetical protein
MWSIGAKISGVNISQVKFASLPSKTTASYRVHVLVTRCSHRDTSSLSDLCFLDGCSFSLYTDSEMTSMDDERFNMTGHVMND